MFVVQALDSVQSVCQCYNVIVCVSLTECYKQSYQLYVSYSTGYLLRLLIFYSGAYSDYSTVNRVKKEQRKKMQKAQT